MRKGILQANISMIKLHGKQLVAGGVAIAVGAGSSSQLQWILPTVNGIRPTNKLRYAAKFTVKHYNRISVNRKHMLRGFLISLTDHQCIIEWDNIMRNQWTACSSLCDYSNQSTKCNFKISKCYEQSNDPKIRIQIFKIGCSFVVRNCVPFSRIPYYTGGKLSYFPLSQEVSLISFIVEIRVIIMSLLLSLYFIVGKFMLLLNQIFSWE